LPGVATKPDPLGFALLSFARRSSLSFKFAGSEDWKFTDRFPVRQLVKNKLLNQTQKKSPDLVLENPGKPALFVAT
jgi:hypothetical protein